MNGDAGSDEHLDRIDLQERWRRLRAHLDEQQLQVIVRRYGLEGHPPMTFEEIANDTGLELWRVKLIDYNTMGLLGHSYIRSVWTSV